MGTQANTAHSQIPKVSLTTDPHGIATMQPHAGSGAGMMHSLTHCHYVNVINLMRQVRLTQTAQQDFLLGQHFQHW
jgi:hypothetical protein